MSTDVICVDDAKEEPAIFLDNLAENVPQNKLLEKKETSVCILAFGVVLPAMMMISAVVVCHLQLTLLLLKHPLESLCEYFLLLSIPTTNWVLWNSLQRNNFKQPIKKGIFNGISIGSAAIVSLVSLSAVILRYPTQSADGTKHGAEVAIISVVFLLSCLTSIFLARLVKDTRLTESSKKKATAYVVSGVVLSSLTFLMAETRPVLIRAAEFMAVSDISETLEEGGWQNKGFQWLKWLNPERELTMECANPKAVGLSGAFLRMDNVSLRQLYFRLTGKPFREDKSANFSTMPDDYLSKHVVGMPISGLSLHRSELYGHVNPRSASNTFYWTFVFKNRSFDAQEARAEIGLPEGAVVSGMTVWRKDGGAQETVFSSSIKDSLTNRWSVAGHDAPGIVTDLGRGRTLLHCYPVPAQGQLKVALALTVPLKMHTLSDSNLPLPRFIDTNFSLKGDHELKVLCESERVAVRKMNNQEIAGPGITLAVSRKSNAEVQSIAALDTQNEHRAYVIQTIKKLPCIAPEKLVVVLDGSCAMSEHLDKLKEVLVRLPKNINASLVVANENETNSGGEMQSVLSKLNKEQFSGGKDNLQAVVKAAESAGESTNGAVLWIHGPQPSFNKEIYIISPYVKKPRFFELALDNGIMESNEYFKLHKEVGPFAAISRNASPAQDLERFLCRWQPGGFEYKLEYSVQDDVSCPLGTAAEQQEVLALFARQECDKLLEAGNKRQAVITAVNHRIVSPVSLASSSISRQSGFSGPVNNDAFRIRPHDNQTLTEEEKAPVLQSTTNGTIGPQGADCYYGVDTAGTVRVNNLANLEALLNVFTGTLEIAGLLWGFVTLMSCMDRFKLQKYDSFLFGDTNKITRAVWGIVAIIGSVNLPGAVNFLISSARDANLFS